MKISTPEIPFGEQIRFFFFLWTPAEYLRFTISNFNILQWQFFAVEWSRVTGTHMHKIQVLQNRILRMAIDTPWYVKNTTIHRDIKLSFFKDTLRKTYSRHHSALSVHPNPLIRHIPLAILHRRLKRKRHTGILTQDWQHKGDCQRPTTSHSSDTWFLFFISLFLSKIISYPFLYFSLGELLTFGISLNFIFIWPHL